MAKPRDGLIEIEGKLGDHIITRHGRYKSYVRKVVKAGTKKDEPALKQQYSRTGFLNVLASDVNMLLTENSEGLKSSRFYEWVQSRFRTEPLNNRLLLLQTLKGMEVNPAYPFTKHGMPGIRCTSDPAGFHVRLEVKHHPVTAGKAFTQYYYEVLGATWTKKEKPGDCERQYSEWVSITGPEPVFDFFFARPKGAIHWMVCVRIRLGRNEVAGESFLADGMQVTDAGSFDKAEQEWLMRQQERKGKPPGNTKKPPVNIVRVKASNPGVKK